MRIHFHGAALGLMLCALPANSLFAQSPPPESPSAPLVISARTVVEDVVVMDKNGRAVPGLHKEAFHVFENGNPQTITFFEPNFASAEAASSSPALPPRTFTNIPLADPHNVTNVLLLDALDSWPEDRMYAQAQMVKYLASLPPGLRIGIFALGAEKTNLIWGLNEDSSALSAAVAGFASGHPLSATIATPAELHAAAETAVEQMRQRAKVTKDPRLAASADALQKFLRYGPGIVEDNHHANTMVALRDLAHYLAGIPGRKNLFWIVGNFPHAEPIGPFAETMCMLADAGVSVYPIDAHGVDPVMGLGPLPLGHQAAARFIDSEYWAEVTGGKAYHANNIKQEIADAVDHGSRYYTLAYVPSDREEEGRERAVEVKMSGNYKISYRKRYFEQTQKGIKQAGTLPAGTPLIPLMGHALPDSAGIPYRLKVTPAAMQPEPAAARAGQNAQLAGDLTRYDVEFQLQPGVLALLPDADGAGRKSIQVALMVYSQDFKPLNWDIREIHLLIKPEQSPKAGAEGVSFHLDIDAPPGDIYLRTGVYDSASKKVGTLEIPLAAVAPAR